MLRISPSNVSSALFLLCIATTLGSAAQQHALESAANSNSSLNSSDALQKIYVDQFCHILPDQIDLSVENDLSALPTDPVICHRESVLTSRHLEETIKDGVPQRSIVKISEQEYLLQDVTTEPVAFVVEQLVPDGWQVDSDPRPTEMIGSTAAFRVIAQPGQTVRLHVGLRHANPMREWD